MAFVAVPDTVDRRGAVQIVFTLTQFSAVRAVRLGREGVDCAFMSRPLRRGDLEAQTPS